MDLYFENADILEKGI